MASSNDSNGGNGTSSSSSNGTLTRNFSLSPSGPRDYDTLKQQYDKTSADLSNSRWRCDHGLSDLDYYREQHRAAMNQLEVSSQDSASLRNKYAELLAEKQRLESDNQRLRKELDNGNGNADKFFLSHSQALTKLELAQDENARLLKQCEIMGQERQGLQRQISDLKAHVVKLYKDNAKYREAHQKLQQQFDETEKQMLAVKIKANKDVKRLTEERNATMSEYTLVMSERDSVHKEMERLTDDLAQAVQKTKMLDADNKELLQEKQSLTYQMESLRREIASALHERDKALKECSDLRERFGDISSKSKEDQHDSQGSRLDTYMVGENAARKDLLLLRHDSRSINQRQRLDNLDQANQELESLRKSLDKVQSELNEAIKEAEVSKGRRDWAFSERDKIVLERESIRTLCDNMRKERDRAVSELAESLRESDAVKKQRNELLKEVKMLKELLEERQEMQHADTELLDIELSGATGSDLGLSLVGGRDDPIRPGDTTVYVAAVAKGSIADGKLKPDDCICKVNDVDCGSVSRRMVLEAIRSSLPQARVLVRRRRNTPVRWIHTARLVRGCHGLTLRGGVYIARISEGSLAARDKSLAVGDRILRINDTSVEEITDLSIANDALNDETVDVLTVTTLKMGPPDTPNVFMPVRKFRKENRSSQTEDMDTYHDAKYSSSSGGAWLKDKFDLMRGRRHSKEKYRTNSPNPEQAIAELDLVLDSYHGGSANTGTVKRSKPKHKEDKNGGTWPKARAQAVLQGTSGQSAALTGTAVVRPKRERAPLSLLIDSKDCCNRNSTPLPLSVTPSPRYSVYRSLDGGPAGDSSLEKLRSSHPHRHSHNLELKDPSGIPYYKKIFNKQGEWELWNRSIHHPFQPHPHPHQTSTSMPPVTNSSRDSFSFEPLGWHAHSSSTDYGSYLRYQQRGISGSNQGQSHHHNLDYLEGGSSGTFPRNQRFRVPSNPSVVSSKLSTGSIERGTGSSERGSPAPIFHVEVLSQGPGELRRVHIDKSNEPLGIQINCPEGGGIFVSSVNEGSLANRVGLQIGDQLLEVCGINMRNATYNLAANVLRQCGNSITMLVQYCPEKYNEIQSPSHSSEEEEPSISSPHDGDEATPCNSPKEIRKLQSPCLPGQHSHQEEPARYLTMKTMKSSNLGISLVGGNAAGIFIHSVQPDSPAYCAGLRTGDQILEYNGSDLRHATAEEAAYELAKPADEVTVLAQQRMARYNEIKDKPGDSLYVRCGFDRSGNELTDPPELSFSKDDVLYIDNTMFNGVPGHWRAWKLDTEGHRQHCGIIPSKYKVEEELLLKRSSTDTATARRSFFRRKKHQRTGSRDSKELASFCNLSPAAWYSEHEEATYQRVERLVYAEFRPVLVLGPLAECIQDKLVSDFPDKFARAQSETRRCPQAQLEQEVAEGALLEYRRRGSCFECTTIAAVRAVGQSRTHCMLDVCASSIERLHRQGVFPVVLLLKFKSTKQIRELKDAPRYSPDKLSAKAAKEMFEHGHKLETEYRHLLTAVLPAGANVAHICAQVKASVEQEHARSQWVPLQ